MDMVRWLKILMHPYGLCAVFIDFEFPTNYELHKSLYMTMLKHCCFIVVFIVGESLYLQILVSIIYNVYRFCALKDA